MESEYMYTALGHTLRFPDGTFVQLYYSLARGSWMVHEGVSLYYAHQYRLVLEHDDQRLQEAL
jgi:hypothetical protein